MTNKQGHTQVDKDTLAAALTGRSWIDGEVPLRHVNIACCFSGY